MLMKWYKKTKKVINFQSLRKESFCQGFSFDRTEKIFQQGNKPPAMILSVIQCRR